MKKSLLALAAMGAFAGAAQAQSSVSVYGVLDAGIGSVSNVNQASTTLPGKTWTGMTTGNLSTSRLGFKGNEDLGGGTQARFVLEMQLFPNTGEAGSTTVSNATTGSATSSYGTSSASSSVPGNTLFDRQATMGLASKTYGSFDMGRQNNVGYDKLIQFDPRAYGNFAGLGSMGVNKFSRVNNSIKYESPTFAGVSISALYSTSDSSSSVAAGSTKEIYANYTNGNFAATAGYSVAQVLCSGAITTTATVTGTTSNYAAGYCGYFGSGSTTPANVGAGWTGLSQSMVGVSYIYGPLTGKAGYLSGKNAAASQTTYMAQANNTLAWAGLAYQLNPVNRVGVSYYQTTLNASASTTAATPKSDMIAVDYQYSMSKRTTLYAVAGFMQNNATAKLSITDNGKISANNNNTGMTPPTGSNQNGATIGMRHVF